MPEPLIKLGPGGEYVRHTLLHEPRKGDSMIQHPDGTQQQREDRYTLPATELPGSAAYHAVQLCPKKQEPVADEPYAPNPERYVSVPRFEEFDVDITDAIHEELRDQSPYTGQKTQARFMGLVMDGDRVIARYEMEGVD